MIKPKLFYYHKAGITILPVDTTMLRILSQVLPLDFFLVFFLVVIVGTILDGCSEGKREIKSFCDFCASLCEDTMGEHKNTALFFVFFHVA